MPMVMHTANIVVHHPMAEVIEKSLRPESMEIVSRAAINIERRKDRLSIVIESPDVNGLRAAINSYLRWMDMTFKIAEKIGD